ncbi:energy-coupling factor ABC transporter ATP-binding protein [Treponema sp. C6A8]|uniref:energy-coupling factor ABC transporter ATP-binding protein n=1 Tax=Treponema sp. C6A8 TaxID=1410609 RepID=UPI0004834223|nr:ABC transporter ATP-binding protein [Treponema sp. C6A8]
MQKLIIDNISKGFNTIKGRRQVLKNVSFEIDEGSFTVIGGENGSGKSLLMSIIAGLEEADSGKVSCFGKVGLVFQEAETQILGETPAEDIAFGPKNLGWSRDRVKEAVETALEKTGLTQKRDFPARFLSGGEKRRLAVACMLAMDLPVLILDEPYANLDYEGVKQVNALLRDLKAQKKTIILLTHEIEKCLGLADRFIVLFRGEKAFDGAPGEIGTGAGGSGTVNVEDWNIRNPFNSYKNVEDLIW